ncbi:MAG: hypothetical protein WCO48_02370 [Candidatus Taylorbacteria bacterium]
MHISRRTRQSASYVEHRRKKAIWVLIIAVVILALGAFTLSWITKLAVFRIDSVRVDGADSDISSVLQSAAQSAISGSYFGLFSKSNSIIYPRGAVVRAVKEASGRVETVETNLNDLHQISISVTEKTPSAMACPGFPEDGGDCFFVDKTGLIYAKAPISSPGIYNRYYISGGYIDGYATSTEEFLRLQTFYSGALSVGLEVESILIKEDGEYEMYILNPDKSIAIVYFNNTKSLVEELSHLLSFWTYMVTDVRTTKTPSSFDYIDVRYGTNVFYRINGGTTSSR